MKILVTGATGLVGTALIAALVRDGHMICRLIRPGTKTEGGGPGTFDVTWNPETGELGGAAVGAEAVVNLAGAPIAARRWSDSRKQVLRASRVDFTRGLVSALGKMTAKPDVFRQCVCHRLLRKPRRRNPHGSQPPRPRFSS